MIFLLAPIFFFFALFNSHALAEKKSTSASPYLPRIAVPEKMTALKKRRAALTTKKTFKKLQRAHQLMTKEEYAKAENILNALLKSTEKRPYEKAQVLQTLAYVYAQKDQFKTALSYFRQALRLNALPAAPTLSTMYSIAQIFASQGKNASARKQLLDWFTHVKSPQPNAYVLYAVLLFEKGKKRASLANLNHALTLTDKPQESWLKMTVSLNFEMGHYREAEELLRQLIEINPSEKKYWKQLAGTYLNLNNYPKGLAALELAHKWGLLKEEKDFLNLVSLYLQENIPLRAAQILEKNIKNKTIKKSKKSYQLLAQAWIMAEEPKKALKPLTLAAKFAKDGEIDIQIGQLHMEQEAWKTAVRFLEQGLKKGKIKRKDRAHLITGIAFYQLQNIEKALEHFKIAAESEKIEDRANRWISHLSK